MKDKRVLIVVMCICASAVALRSEEPSQTKPAAESPALPAGSETQINSPKDASDTAAAVGDAIITNEKIKSILQNLPHILIACEPLASTKRQKTAKAKLEKIAAEIKAGKLKFEDAARCHSACPSKERGGMLSEFLFTDMLPPFSLAAFETDAGKISDITRTKFGFHLIKVIGRTEGKEKPDMEEKMKEIAKSVLLAELKNKLLDQALKTVPIVIPNKNPQTRPEAKATAGKPNEKK